MNHQLGSPNRRLRLESLESRSLLAGNVLASVTDGSLSITGNADANLILITQTADNAFRISGNAGTEINGSAFVDLTNVSGAVNINLRGGNDVVVFNGPAAGAGFVADFDGDFSIDAGAGNDSLTLSNIEVDGDVSINTGAGNDRLTASEIEATGDVSVNAGVGNDNLTLTGASAASLSVNLGAGNDTAQLTDLDVDGAISLNAGDGNDSLTISGAASADDDADNVSVNLGGGNDTLNVSGLDVVGNVNVTGGAGNDSVSLSGEVEGDVSLELGAGNDKLSLNNLTVVDGDLNIHLGAGNDKLTVSGLDVDGDVNLTAGLGNDNISLGTIAADELFAALGQGNDRLALTANIALAGTIHVQGGAGRDTLRGKSLIDAALEEFLGLETQGV
jgi:Ca2+-binding RTX toxin-like protein